MISHLERLNINPQQAWMEALKEYREIEPGLWHMPEGYRQRVAPEYLTKVYSAPRSGKEYAQQFLRERQLEGCGAAKGMVDALACVDRLLLEDRTPDLGEPGQPGVPGAEGLCDRDGLRDGAVGERLESALRARRSGPPRWTGT